jgi:hypothetical protein
MIEQLWYTWSTIGLGSVTGFRVRAASPGLSNIRNESFRALENHLRYDLPIGVDPYEANMKNSPCCLSLLEVDNRRILVHKVYLGKDAYGRPGVPFIHLLEGLPPAFLARDATRLWNSSFWQKSDRDLSPDMFALKQIASTDDLDPGLLNIHTLLPFQEELVFIIRAYLSLKPEQRLYIAADAEKCATLIWGLTRVLPRILQEHLTFSTYEHDVHAVDARIIGTCWASDARQDLPLECYEGKGLALNSYSGRRSSLANIPLAEAYAHFAINCLLSNDRLRLEELLNIADRMHIADTSSLLVIYELFNGKRLSRDRITKLLDTYELAAGLLTQEGIQDSIIQLVCDDPQWWQEHGKSAIAVLRTHGSGLRQGLNALAERAATIASSALLRNDSKTRDASLTVLLEAAPPDDNPAPWISLLQHFTPAIEAGEFSPAQLHDWSIKGWLLIQWAEAAKHINNQLISPWLQIPWEELPPLLSLPIPMNWQTQAVMKLLMHSDDSIPSFIMSIVSENSVVFEEALRNLMKNGDTQPIAINFFAVLVKHQHTRKMKMLSILLEANPQAYILESLLQMAQLTDKEQADIFAQHTQRLLTFERLSPEILDLITAYLENFTIEDLSNPVAIQTLQRILKSEARLPQEYVQAVSDRKIAADAIVQGGGTSLLQFNTRYLTMLGNAIHRLQLYDEAYLQKLFSSLSSAIRNEEELDNVVKILAPGLEMSKYKLFRYLADARGTLYNKKISHSLLRPYIILACLYASDPQSPRKEQFILPVLQALLKKVERPVFDAIDREASGWAPVALKEWRAHSAKLRPTTLMDGLIGILPFMKPSGTQAAQNNMVATQKSQAASSDWVARIWTPDKRPKLILSNHFERLYRLQELYIPLRRGELQNMKESRDQEWIEDERDMLLNLTDPIRILVEIREMLVNDVLILYEFEHGQAAQYEPKTSMKKKQEDILRKIKGQENYRKYVVKGPFTEKDVREILAIFLSYQDLAQYLWKQKKLVQKWLKDQKQVKGIKIEFSENLPSIPGK